MNKVKISKKQIGRKEFYLIGGGEYNDKPEIKIETGIFQENSQLLSSVLVIPWTSDNPIVLKKYKKIIIKFFENYGAKSVKFLEKVDSQKIMEEKFAAAKLIYLPGGDVEVLLKNIKDKKVDRILKKFSGTIAGVSAGAYVLSAGFIKIKNKKILFVPTLNFIDVIIKAHYTKDEDKFLIPLSRTRKIFGIADNSATVFNDKKFKKSIGNIYIFDKGKKRRLKK